PSPPHLYTLSLHDALPIWIARAGARARRIDDRGRGCGTPGRSVLRDRAAGRRRPNARDTPRAGNESVALVWVSFDRRVGRRAQPDRKSTRLNSSHVAISYA